MNFAGSPDVIAELVALYRASVPPDIASENGDLDEAWSAAAIFAATEAAIADWARAIMISTATGAALDALARDRGLSRTSGESDDSLRARISAPPTAGTLVAIYEAVRLVVDANGGGQIYLFELPKTGVYYSRSMCFNRGGSRLSSPRPQMVVVVIPAAGNCVTAVQAALLSKLAAGKSYLVETYS